jgi:2-keto-4-pentenoate hydratase
MSQASLSPAAIQRAADILADTFKKKTTIAALPADATPETMADAYAIQEAMNKRLGFKTVGWKFAHSNPAAIRKSKLGGPVPGRVFPEMLQESPARYPAGSFHFPRFEPEIAFKLKADLPPRATPYSRDEVLAAVGSAHIAIEIADARLTDPLKISVPVGAADNMGHGGLIVGKAIDNWRTVPFTTIGIRLRSGGKVIAEPVTGESRCDPIEVLVWSANEMSRRGEGLKAGMVLSTGSHTVPTHHPAPCTVIGEFDGLGQIDVTLEG